MRTVTALVIAALGMFVIAGCKKSSQSSGPKQPAKTAAAPKTPVATAPANFKIEPMNAEERSKAATGVVGNISAQRKKQIEELVAVLLNTGGAPLDRIKAANALSDLCDPMAAPFLMTRVTDDPSRDVKLAALAALGHIADPAAAPVLIALLDDKDLGLATAALNALGEMTGGSYAFVNGTTIKVRKADKAVWETRLKEGYFKTLGKN
jgi:hypothetical protein